MRVRFAWDNNTSIYTYATVGICVCVLYVYLRAVCIRRPPRKARRRDPRGAKIMIFIIICVYTRWYLIMLRVMWARTDFPRWTRKRRRRRRRRRPLRWQNYYYFIGRQIIRRVSRCIVYWVAPIVIYSSWYLYIHMRLSSVSCSARQITTPSAPVLKLYIIYLLSLNSNNTYI